MAAAELRKGEDGSTRLLWGLAPLESVGPLRFGMRINDVAEVLPSMIEPRRFQADPHLPHILGAQFGTGHATPAVYTYFDDADRLFCVAVDAAYGPHVTLDGLELTACVPAEVEQLLLDASRSAGLRVSYGPRGNPGVNGLGLVVRVQEIAGGVATRPVLVGRDWADRCTDDWEGQIPECEWVGRQWTYPGHSDHWPPPGYAPTWGDWRPPFQPEPAFR
ncbi:MULTISPECIES: hypothetical protein [unclassified Streptomyces]|uniref:hypothetical protein n=1 Tax=unclassified Streptomyces TaxID=2593676 RepID=UPI000A933E53|nr:MULTISPECIES: hypothetical protein [unclassified Streptomyces]MYQ87326.1 hypothetical protein [Streptomyces sp. SID4936]